MALTQNQMQAKVLLSEPQIVSQTYKSKGLDNLSTNITPGVKKTTLIAIAPMNALPGQLVNMKSVSRTALADMSTRPMPRKFSWHRVKGYRGEQLTKPQNQGMCGCCWAMATATAISDNFVTAQILQNNPKLSTTWCLSCMQDPNSMLGCKGGNPAKLMDAIQKKGIARKSCTNWDEWCGKNPLCTPITDKEKTAARQAVANSKVDFNQELPSCGCENNDVDHYILNIKDAQNYWIGENDQNPSPKEFATTIKAHIYDHGPVVTIFVVYKNFAPGLWAHTTHGVYLENFNYTQDEEKHTIATFDKSQTSSDNFVGGHAVTVIGWGITDEKIFYGIDDNGEELIDYIPYWVTRNTWTEEWGEGGYFKMAMYPYNKVSQFDKPVVLKDANGNPVFDDRVYGGMTLITLDSSIPAPRRVIDTSNSSTMKVQNNPSSSIEEEPLIPVTKKEGEPVQIDDDTTDNITKKISWKKILIGVSIVIGIGLVLFLGVYLWRKYGSVPQYAEQPKINIIKKDKISGEEYVIPTTKTLQEVILPTATVSPSTTVYDPLKGVSNTLGAKLYY